MNVTRLIVGSHGLLGSAVWRTLAHTNAYRARVDWHSPHAERQLTAAAVALAAQAGHGEWEALWCAGAGVTGASAHTLDKEVSHFRTFLDALVGSVRSRGTLFLASSAGGVYGGSSGPPFTEASRPEAISPYGHAKLAMERAAAERLSPSGHRLLIGRIANLYGPGQNLAKAQGLISHLCRNNAVGAPTNIYVPIDTIRDYLYAPDCAHMIAAALSVVRERDLDTTLKIFAAGRGVTIGGLIGECARVFHRRPRIIQATSPLAPFQSSDLRLRSTVFTDINPLAATPLPAGIAATDHGIRLQLMNGQYATARVV